ncbi:MAG TPA: hypothetical protein V6C58_25015 [Allocoleopsis sp.]
MLKKIAVFGLVTLNTILLNLPAPIVQAQKSTAFTCINVSGSRIYGNDNPISVGKRIRRPIYGVYLNSHESTCEITDKNVTQLNFSLTIADNSNMQMAEFSVFLDGKIAKKVQVKRGTELTFSVPLKKRSKNFAIEAQKQGKSDTLYFLKYEAK